MLEPITRDETRRYRVALSRIKQIGPVRLGRLLAAFPDGEAGWRASGRDLIAAGIEPKATEQILAERPRLDPDKEWDRIERGGFRVLLATDPDYPTRLREIYAAPPILYAWGALTAGDDLAIAVVGTRRAPTTAAPSPMPSATPMWSRLIRSERPSVC